MPAAMDATLLIPARDECEALRTLLPEIREVMDPLGITYEVIVVDDGSRDETWELLRSLSSGWPNLTGIRLRKSAGQTAALQAGFDYACGEVIITLDGDGQNDPKDIPVLLEKLAEGYDLVSGWRRDRKDKGFSRVLPSMIANRFIRFWTGSRLRDQGCGLKAYRRPILQGLSMLGDQHRYIAALLEGLGSLCRRNPCQPSPTLHRPEPLRLGACSAGPSGSAVSEVHTQLFAAPAAPVRRRGVPRSVCGIPGLPGSFLCQAGSSGSSCRPPPAAARCAAAPGRDGPDHSRHPGGAAGTELLSDGRHALLLGQGKTGRR
ncbi:MAG: Undecaprenyl-phosphate 4-deoxy-4-formamido-L-arabinose transferase [Candidatus Hinthialibacteria bacterium OLB16]|nr:MAG: Undecaprenyl-phosphate 4-deoxy-4-formamido-L-arabinose transferase [Candidatus Hinthialibacteria bacterium OLB16]